MQASQGGVRGASVRGRVAGFARTEVVHLAGPSSAAIVYKP